MSPAFALERTLSDALSVRDWRILGLPADAFSTQNGVLVTYARRWPLMIDPQGQANKWIRATERKRNMEITRMSNPNLLRSLENCIRTGK